MSDHINQDKEGEDKILRWIGEVPIRKVNYQKVKYNEVEFTRLAKVALLTNLPISKIIALSSQPCPVCGNDHVMITIPLGILSTRKQSTGNFPNKNIKDNDSEK